MALAKNFEQTSTTTREFTFEFLERITDNFSEEHIIGSGGYGVVYKGVLDNGEKIALKKLRWMPGLDDTQFRNEFNNLMRAQHPNITRLVGYCYHLGHQRIKFKGEYIFPLVEERVLCFEYLQGGSLDKCISDESCGLDWHTRFKIIKGVCLGLNYLHNGSKNPIYHLDLKPANILLDKNMVPKIGDFGLSRLFPSAQTYITTKIMGTLGYMPPEYIERNEITSKYDVFSLGVIITRIMAGDEGYSKCAHMSSEEFIEHVHENWGKRLQATMSSHTSDQVKRCIEIALRCVEVDRKKRPTIAEIVDELNKVPDFRSKPLHRSWQSSWWRDQIIAKLGDLARLAVALAVLVGPTVVALAFYSVARMVISSVAYLVARIVLSSAGCFILGLVVCIILTRLAAATYLGSIVERTRQRTLPYATTAVLVCSVLDLDVGSILTSVSTAYFLLGFVVSFILTTLAATTYLGSVVKRIYQRLVPYATTILLGCFVLGSVVSFPNTYFVLGLVVGLWYTNHWVAIPATCFLWGLVVGSILTLPTAYFLLGLVVSFLMLYWATCYTSQL